MLKKVIPDASLFLIMLRFEESGFCLLQNLFATRLNDDFFAVSFA
jgi:hypothetical protein